MELYCSDWQPPVLVQSTWVTSATFGNTHFLSNLTWDTLARCGNLYSPPNSAVYTFTTPENFLSFLKYCMGHFCSAKQPAFTRSAVVEYGYHWLLSWMDLLVAWNADLCDPWLYWLRTLARSSLHGPIIECYNKYFTTWLTIMALL